jgi:hypothetical protein
MLKAYPHRACVDAAVVFLTLAVAATSARSITDPLLWLPVGMAVAGAWLIASDVLKRVEDPLCRRLGVVARDYSAVVRQWSLVLGLIAGFLTAALVSMVVFATMLCRRCSRGGLASRRLRCCDSCRSGRLRF